MIERDKCASCRCLSVPTDKDCEYMLGSESPYGPNGAVYVPFKTLPPTVKMIVEGGGTGDQGKIMASMIADLEAAGGNRAGEPSEKDMESLCKGETSLNAV